MRNSAWEQRIKKPETLRDNPTPLPREYNSQHKPQETETGRQKDPKNQRETDRGREKREGRETEDSEIKREKILGAGNISQS